MVKRVPGEKAPDFTLTDQHGNSVRLSDFAGRKVFIYFYPKADTPGCTTQACSVREALPDLQATGVVTLGISPDAPAKQKLFDEKYQLGFPLLSDGDHAVTLSYGAWGEKSQYGRTYEGLLRSAFLIDEQGRILQTWYKIRPQDTVPFVRKALG